MSSEWKAPGSMRVSVFFKITPCCKWNDVMAYLKVAKVEESVEKYYQTYVHGLRVISESDGSPEEVKSKVRDILERTSMKLFSNTHRAWVIDTEKKEACDSLAVGYARLAKRAGSILQREEGKKGKGSRAESSFWDMLGMPLSWLAGKVNISSAFPTQN
ncbi:hypothetical protein BGZ68_001539 [Mortierella alpina]|nr:hypothetical protein BGZ68_001539 [Mortierella alpina]